MFGERNGCEQTNQNENKTNQWELPSKDIKMCKWWENVVSRNKGGAKREFKRKFPFLFVY